MSDPSSVSSPSQSIEVELVSPAAEYDQVSLQPELVIELAGAESAPDTLSEIFELVGGSEVFALEFSKDEDGLYKARPTSLLKAETRYQIRQVAPIVTENGVLQAGASWSFTTTGELAATPQWVIDSCMNDDATFTLAQINAVRASGVKCGTDYMPAVPQLRYSCKLQQAAYRHSRDMAENDFFSHSGSDGSRAGERITATGYAWRTWSENIAAGQIDASHAFAELLASPGHCRNMMSADFTELGIALYSGKGQYRRYWTQVFATPR